MKQRSIALLALLTLLLSALVGSTTAQVEAYCLDLNEADCAIYTAFQANTALPTSTAFEMNVAGNIDVPDQPLEFGATITGAYATDAAAYQEAVDTFGAITLRDVSLGDLSDVLNGMISAWDSELSIDLSGTPQIAPMLGGQTIDLYFVDGGAYADLTLVSTLTGDESMAGVFGVSVFEAGDFGLNSVTMADVGMLYQMLGSMGSGAGADIDVDAIEELLTGEIDLGLEDNPAFQNFLQGLESATSLPTEEELTSFVTLTRLDDAEVNGETVVVFQTDVDAAATLNAPFIREQVISALAMQDLPEEMDMEAFIDGIAAGVAGSTVTVTERYSEASGFLVGVDITMDITVDPAPIAESIGETVGENDLPISIDMTISFNRNSINAVDAIELPQGAELVPFMALLGG